MPKKRQTELVPGARLNLQVPHGPLGQMVISWGNPQEIWIAALQALYQSMYQTSGTVTPASGRQVLVVLPEEPAASVPPAVAGPVPITPPAPVAPVVPAPPPAPLANMPEAQGAEAPAKPKNNILDAALSQEFS